MSDTPSLTGYPIAEAWIREFLGDAPVSASSLQRPLSRCDLERCGGMCCHDGIYLENDEPEVIEDLVQQEGEFFKEIGLNLPEKVIVHSEFRDLVAGPHTELVPRVWRDRVKDYPAHFTDTACCFLTDDGRCGLQMLSVARGKHRWYYKPIGCWMHPITMDLEPYPTIGLVTLETDPYHVPGYEGFVSRTFCAAVCQGGSPAYETLREELTMLGSILNRDLMGEIYEQLMREKSRKNP